ncbi:MAG: transposase [Rhizobiales bacterium]|nr:transposase [Hyphomicrobiales bacterium]
MQNAFVASLNGRFRDERLDEHSFRGLRMARRIIETWRVDPQQVRHPVQTGLQAAPILAMNGSNQEARSVRGARSQPVTVKAPATLLAGGP